MEQVAVRDTRYRVYLVVFLFLTIPAIASLAFANALSVGSLAIAGIAAFAVMVVMWINPRDLSFGLTVVEVDEEYESGRLDAHLAFGFAPDPVFPELEWDDDEDSERTH